MQKYGFAGFASEKNFFDIACVNRGGRSFGKKRKPLQQTTNKKTLL